MDGPDTRSGVGAIALQSCSHDLSRSLKERTSPKGTVEVRPTTPQLSRSGCGEPLTRSLHNGPILAEVATRSLRQAAIPCTECLACLVVLLALLGACNDSAPHSGTEGQDLPPGNRRERLQMPALSDSCLLRPVEPAADPFGDPTIVPPERLTRLRLSCLAACGGSLFLLLSPGERSS